MQRLVLAAPERVVLEVLDAAGRRRAAPVDGAWFAAGVHELRLERGELANGVYWARLTAGAARAVRKRVVA